MRLKKSLFTVVLTLMFASPAFATKAKLSALQGARFLTDSQLIFENPAQIHGLKNYVTYELGSTVANPPAGTPKSEGGLFKEMYGGRGGFYLGHMSEEQILFRANNGFLTEENPVEFFFGKNSWAASIGFSMSDKKTTDQKQTTVIARFGIDQGDMEAWINAEFVARGDNGDDDYKGAPIVTVGGELHMTNDIYLNGKLQYGKIDEVIGGISTDTDIWGVEIAALDRSIKNEKAFIYFGPKIRYAQIKIGDAKIKTFDIPLFIGMEYKAASWIVARASVSQNFILGQTKNGLAAAPGDKSDSITNNTTVSTGIGLQWDTFMVDATLAGSTTGEFNGNTLLANLGIIYNF